MGYENKSGSDCECIAPYYRHVGSFQKLIEDLDGDFGIAMYDMISQMTYIARDRMGIRSLYYAIDEEKNFYVASELKAIPNDMNNVRAFPPGYWAQFNVKTGTLDMNCYWTLKDRIPSMPRPDCSLAALADDKGYQAFCVKIRESLTAAVKKRFMSDRPIGCILSGGLDSTTVTAIACKI